MAKLTFSPAGLEVLEDAPVRTNAEVRICEAEALARLIEFGPDELMSELKGLEAE